MFPTFNASCMAAIFPICTFSFLSKIVFLGTATRCQLYRFWYGLTLPTIYHQKMNVVGGHHVIQDSQPITPFGFKQSLNPSPLVFGKFQKKFSLVTAMYYVPHLARNIMSFRAWHFFVFGVKKIDISPIF